MNTKNRIHRAHLRLGWAAGEKNAYRQRWIDGHDNTINNATWDEWWALQRNLKKQFERVMSMVGIDTE